MMSSLITTSILLVFSFKISATLFPIGPVKSENSCWSNSSDELFNWIDIVACCVVPNGSINLVSSLRNFLIFFLSHLCLALVIKSIVPCTVGVVMPVMFGKDASSFKITSTFWNSSVLLRSKSVQSIIKFETVGLPSVRVYNANFSPRVSQANRPIPLLPANCVGGVILSRYVS